MFFIFRLIINMVAILIISYLFPKMIWVEGFLAALVAAFLLGLSTRSSNPSWFCSPSSHCFDFRAFSLGHQWIDALVGVSSVSGFHVSGFWARCSDQF